MGDGRCTISYIFGNRKRKPRVINRIFRPQFLTGLIIVILKIKIIASAKMQLLDMEDTQNCYKILDMHFITCNACILILAV